MIIIFVLILLCSLIEHTPERRDHGSLYCKTGVGLKILMRLFLSKFAFSFSPQTSLSMLRRQKNFLQKMKGQGILLDIVRLQLKLVQPFHFQGCYFQRK